MPAKKKKPAKKKPQIASGYGKNLRDKKNGTA